ncbi:MAG: FAD-binding protein [Actinomycetota bacterium]
MDLIHPHAAHDVQEAIRDCAAAGRRLLVVGGRQHLDKGDQTEVDAELWTTLLDDVVTYDPAEMLIVVEAGMRVGELRRALARRDQEWPIDAPDDTTVGGIIAAGIEPIRRLRVGLMRDTVVEMEAVLGDGRRITSGARVVKNVSGFDVHRLLTGSLGTLGVITQVALKVRPIPKAAVTLVTSEGGLALGGRLLDALWQPAAVLAEPGRVIVRLEGWPAEVAEQSATVRALATCEEADDGAFTEPPFAASPILAEVGVVPSRLSEVLDGSTAYRALLGVGTAWVPCTDQGELASLRRTVVKAGGIAPVIRGPGGLGDADLPAVEIDARIKAACDPSSILTPGRGWGGSMTIIRGRPPGSDR